MAQGYIQEIQAKETRVGTMYDLVIDGRKIGVGKFPPKGFSAGDYVNYEVEQKGNFVNLKAGSVSKATPPAGVPAPSSPSAATNTSAVFAKADAKDEAYSRGASANTAIALLKILSDQDALPMPAKVSKDQKADLIYDIFQEYTARIYTMTTGRSLKLESSKTASSGNLADAESSDESWTE
jgi:hypothetical protein